MSTTDIELDSGLLPIGNAATGEVHKLDLMLLQLTIERVERTASLPIEDGRKMPTVEFLTDLAKAIEGLGFAGCTPTQAHQIWILASVAMFQLKKNMLSAQKSVIGSTSTPAHSRQENSSDTEKTSPESEHSSESTPA